MSRENDANDGEILMEPLSISDLLQNGASFQINTDFDDKMLENDDFFEDFNVQGSDDEDEVREVVLSPWDSTFDELRAHMVQINEHIYKRITKEGDADSGPVPENARCLLDYNSYWEKSSEPFDSTFLRGQKLTLYCGKNQVLEGIELAVRSMKAGEEAQFVISYHLLFGEMGCPSRIKPKADGLYIIKLIKFENIGNENAIDEVSEQDRNKFSVIFGKVQDVHLKGVDNFKNGNIQTACRLFHKAVNSLEFCRLSNEEEQKEQRSFLIKLYLNLAVCYNKLKLYTKTCSMCNEIRKLTDINYNCKALFQEGRALLKIGEFERAKQRLKRAQVLEPTNDEISKELRLLAQEYENHRTNEKSIWRKAMGVVSEKEEKPVAEHIERFRGEIEKYLIDFKNNDNTKQLPLPDGLSIEEVDCLDTLTKEFGLKLHINEICNKKSYMIVKNVASS